MASRSTPVGTNAHNLFQSGWIEAEKVKVHPGGSVTYTIVPPHSPTGTELLMLPLTSNRLISIGARVREGFDRNIPTEGVEITQITLCSSKPGCKGAFLPPDTVGNEAVVLSVGDTWTARVDTLRHGKGAVTDLTVTVMGRLGDFFAVRVEEASTQQPFSAIGVGRSGVCGIREEGAVSCWDWRGGDAPPQGAFTSISVGNQACGLRSHGAITCWGRDNDGSTPPEGSFVEISVNGYYGCGLRSHQTVSCWGSDHNAQPIVAQPTGQFQSVSTGWSHACGIRPDQTVECWGSPQFGETTAPTGEFISVKSGGFFSCALRIDSTIHCWGAGDDGRTTPPAGRFAHLDAGWDHACALRHNGSVACWGNNTHGQSSSARGIFTAISVGDARTCGLRLDHSVDCWGRNRLEE